MGYFKRTHQFRTAGFSPSRQLSLFDLHHIQDMPKLKAVRRNADQNKLSPEDRSVHDWYRFVLSFPPHLVDDYLAKFEIFSGKRVLDPFCGTGTTLVECKKHGVESVGIEANTMAYFASSTKVNWCIDAESLRLTAHTIATEACHAVDRVDFSETDSAELLKLDNEAEKLLLTNSISPKPLHKSILLRNLISELAPAEVSSHLLLALASTTVFTASNLQFGPEVGVGAARDDAPVIDAWLDRVNSMAHDIEHLHSKCSVLSVVSHGDSRSQFHDLADESIDAVFTSPPYPNEKDYTRTTRLESVLLGFISSRAELQAMKRTLLRSNTRNVYKGDQDHKWIETFPEITEIADQIEQRRIELGKTSGFERMYPRVTKLYFGGMARHFAEMRRVLKPGAMLGYVVGDQASYLRVMIRTGQLLARIAESLGYEVVGIDLFRTRLATATKEQLREEVVVLRWPGA